jgi:hypothetical protein
LAKRRSTLEKVRELKASKPVNPLSFFQKQSSKVSPSKMMSSLSGRNIAVFDSYGVLKIEESTFAIKGPGPA